LKFGGNFLKTFFHVQKSYFTKKLDGHGQTLAYIRTISEAEKRDIVAYGDIS